MKRLLPILLILVLLLTGCDRGPDLLDSKSPADDLGALYDTNIPLPGDTSEPYLYAVEEDLLFLTINYTDIGVCDLNLHRMSTHSGEITHSAVIPAAGLGTVQVHGDTVCLSSAPSGRVWTLSAELEVLAEYSFEPNYNSWHVSPDLRTLYQLGWDTGLQAYDMANGAMTQLLPKESSVSYQDADNDTVFFTYVDPETQMTEYGSLELATGQIRQFSQEGYFRSLTQQGDLWVAMPYNRENTYLLGQGDTPLGALSLPNCYIDLTAQGRLLCRDYTTGIIGLYDSRGQFLSALQLPMSQYGPSGYISDFMAWNEERGGYFLLLTTFTEAEEPGMEPTQTTSLMFWDLTAEVSGENLALSEYDFADRIPGGVTADRSLYDRAAAMGEQYGVTIRIADQCETGYDDFDTYTVSDSGPISRALDELEKALQKYPAGFFHQLRYDTIQTIEFNLTGTLTPLREDQRGSFVTAFAKSAPGKYRIVADLFTATEITFHHELSHVIDSRLQWDADHRAGALFSEEGWAALNPAGFAYDQTYALHLNRWNVDYSAFIASYSCTYPTEDRATIWEQAMVGNDYPFRGGALREKLSYYCRCVRDCFDTAGWPDVTLWEAVLYE